MLIEKGGISREIDEKHLQQYRDKGYRAVEKEPPVPAEPETDEPKKTPVPEKELPKSKK